MERLVVAREVEAESLAFFQMAESSSRRTTGDGRPLLLLPRETLGWTETAIYFANMRTCACSGVPLLVVELRTFDARARRELDPSEVDWCIPMGYPGASDRARATWAVGIGEGWSDSREVVTLVLGTDWREWLSDVARTRTLAVGEIGQSMASLLQQLDRNLAEISAFTKER